MVYMALPDQGTQPCETSECSPPPNICQQLHGADGRRCASPATTGYIYALPRHKGARMGAGDRAEALEEVFERHLLDDVLDERGASDKLG